MNASRRLLALAPLGAIALAAAAWTPALAQFSPIDPNMIHTSEHHAYRVVPVAEGFERPWSIAFLPGGDMLVTELSGRLRIVRDGTLLPDPVSGLPQVRQGGQGGLLDVVPHPEFASNRLLYISYSKPNSDGSEGTTAVIRGTLQNDALTNVEEIFEAQAWTAGRGHHGSRLAFDRDRYLFISVGDRQARTDGDLQAHPAQDPSNHYGTISRLHDDGRIPSDNPFVGQAGHLPEIWSYGHRNPQGMAVHPETNEVWANEHGPQGGDELNLIRPGLNYGWPVIGFGVNYGEGTPIHEAVHMEGLEQPVHHWTPSIATAGLMIYTGDKFPRWQGSLFTGGMRGELLARVNVDGHTAVTDERLVRDLGRIRDVRQGPDGLIYLAIDHQGGELTPIVRLEPAD
ncbi:MAG: PQQ-dependent sugar dehydrogenase [Gemmatimonadota bacterium]